MIPKRIIPMFLLRGKRLVKGTNFADFIDVGDPVSQAMIYDAQGAEEIAIVDIAATREGRLIDVGIIKTMIEKCRLPISAGGGIKSLSDARKCFGAGADKIIVNTAAAKDPSLIKALADEFGAQSVVVSLDVKKNKSGGYDIYASSGRDKVNKDIFETVRLAAEMGAGEIIITVIDREGTLRGFDNELYGKLRKLVNVPLIASGGAGSYDHIVDLFKRTDFDACALGKMLFLRDYDIVRIKSYLTGRKILVRDA